MNRSSLLFAFGIGLVIVTGVYAWPLIFPEPCQNDRIIIDGSGGVSYEECDSVPIQLDCLNEILWVHEVNGEVQVDILPGTLPRNPGAWVQYDHHGPIGNGDYTVEQAGGSIVLESVGGGSIAPADAELGYIMWCGGDSSVSNAVTLLIGVSFFCPQVAVALDSVNITRPSVPKNPILTTISKTAWSNVSQNLRLLEKYFWADISASSARAGIGTKIVIVDNFKNVYPQCALADRLKQCTNKAAAGSPLSYTVGSPLRPGKITSRDRWVLMCEMRRDKVIIQEECHFLVVTNCHTHAVHIFNTLECPIRMQLAGVNGERIQFYKPNDCAEVSCTACSDNASDPVAEAVTSH